MKKTTISILLILFIPAGAFPQADYSTSWEKETILIGSGITAFLASSIMEKPMTPLTLEEIGHLSPLAVNSFDRPAIHNYSKSLATWSDVCVGISALSPVALLSLKEVRSSCGIYSLMYLETILLSVFVPQLIKKSVERYRPYAYNPAVPLAERTNPDARRSFLSGHTTSAFASALFLSTVYSHSQGSAGEKIYVWAASLLAASAVGYLRYISGSHFPTDILAAVITGVAIGYIVPALHRSSSK